MKKLTDSFGYVIVFLVLLPLFSMVVGGIFTLTTFSAFQQIGINITYLTLFFIVFAVLYIIFSIPIIIDRRVCATRSDDRVVKSPPPSNDL